MVIRKFIDDKAISPIIGTILMVAITVIMAAIIANWSSTIKAPETPKSVGLDVSRLSKTNVTITITSIDPPQTVVDHLTASFRSNATSTPSVVKATILGNGAPTSTGNGNVTTNYPSTRSTAEVGDSATLYVPDYGEFVVIVATFGDGSTKALYSQKV